MKKYPHVTFHLNRELDKKMIEQFLGLGSKAGIDFSSNILKVYPKLKGYQKLTKEKEKLFIVYGAGHAHVQEPALRKIFEKY